MIKIYIKSAIEVTWDFAKWLGLQVIWSIHRKRPSDLKEQFQVTWGSRCMYRIENEIWTRCWKTCRVVGGLRRLNIHNTLDGLMQKRRNQIANALKLYFSLQWRHYEHDGVSNHQPHDCLLNRLFIRRSKKISKLRVTGLCEGNSPVNSPQKGPVTGKMFPFDDVIIS